MKWNLTLIFCSIFLSVTGCSIVRQPSPEEYESVRQNQKAIVLFRLTGSRDGKEVHVLLDSIGSYPNFVFLSFGLANLNANEPLKVISVRGRAPFRSSYAYFSPSSEIAETGWGAFLLKPGAYYLSVTSSPKGVIAPEPEFSFVVPPNKPLVYIGSLHVACTSTENAGWSGGWTLGYRACSPDATAANEDEAAKLVAQASFKEFGPPLSAIMHHYPSTTLAPGTLSQVAPIGLLMPSATIDIGSPEWMRRALQIGLSPSALLGALGASGGGLGGGVLVGFAVLWAPVGTVLGYVGGKFSESSWEPCRLALQESITKFDPMTALATQLKAALDHEGVQSLMIGTVANAGDEISVSEIKSVLNSRMTRVGLRLCSPTLCLDVATHVTLFDVATQTYVYDKVLAYSGAESELPYELRVTKPGYITALPGRDLEAYCGEGGGEKLQGDLSEALDATVAQIVHDFGLKLQ